MVKEKGKYTIKVQAVYVGHDGQKHTSGWTRDTNLYFDSPEDCHKVIDLAKVEGWTICCVDGSLSDKEVEVSPIIANHRNEEKAQRENHNREQEELVKRINAQPTAYKRTYGEGKTITTLILKRATASYDPKMSRNVQIGISAEIKHGAITQDLWLSNYITRAGATQKQKFVEYYNRITPHSVLIADDLKEIQAQVEAIKRGES